MLFSYVSDQSSVSINVKNAAKPVVKHLVSSLHIYLCQTDYLAGLFHAVVSFVTRFAKQQNTAVCWHLKKEN